MPVKQVLADIESPLALGLAALVLAEDRAKHPYLSGDDIVTALEAAGVAIQRTQITRAFSRAGNKVSRKSLDGDTLYRVMTHGRREVEPLLQEGEITVSYIEGGNQEPPEKNWPNCCIPFLVM